MNTLSKIMLATAAIAVISGCSSELNDEDQAALDARVAEENKLPETIAEIISGEEDLSTMNTAFGLTALPAQPEAAEGPFTQFAPTNDAFNKLGVEESAALMAPEQKEKLATILAHHVFKGAVTKDDFAKAIKDSDGTATFTAMRGGDLKVSMDGDKIIITDSSGNKSTVVSEGLKSDKGLVYKIDTVLMPG